VVGIVDRVEGREDDAVVEERAVARAEVQREQPLLEDLELARELVLCEKPPGDHRDALERFHRGGLSFVLDDEEAFSGADFAHPLDFEHRPAVYAIHEEGRMDLATIRELYDYNRWANARTLDAASRASSDGFSRDLGGSFGSLRGTLAHLFGAEWIWLERWRGISPRSLPLAADFPDVEAVRGRWSDVERGQQEFLSGLDPGRLREVVSYVNLKGQTFAYPLWRMLLHVVNHSSYHRGQVATLLRQLGATPLSTDLLLYDDEMGGATERS